MINEIKKELLKCKDEKYRTFSSSLLPETNNILGVRLPVLRKISKHIAKGRYIDFLKQNDSEYFELDMLEGMVIGELNLPFEEKIKYIKAFIPKINNWSLCDSFCSGLKIISKNKDKIKPLLEKYLNSSEEYELRFAYVILLDYFIDSEYDYVINNICRFKSKYYYAEMGAAWCLSICIIKYFDKALNDIKKLKIEPKILKKGITKAIESKRLSQKQKDKLKILRNK